MLDNTCTQYTQFENSVENRIFYSLVNQDNEKEWLKNNLKNNVSLSIIQKKKNVYLEFYLCADLVSQLRIPRWVVCKKHASD